LTHGSSDHDRADDRRFSNGASTAPAPDTAVTATAQVPELDERALNALARVGREWSSCVPDRSVWERALPIDADLDFGQPPESPGGRFVQVQRPRPRGERADLEATDRAKEGSSRAARAAYVLKRLLVGRALRSTALAEERMGRAVALGVLSPDALSSVAYGPEAMLAVLVLAGTGELKLSLPIGAVLALLMLSVGLGYRQVIRAYPHGGGSYVVAGDNLGHRWGLLAGAGLIVDYVLTVAVSVASGVEAVTSAIPSVYSDRVLIGLLVIAVLVAGNLRGVREAGVAFAAPTYLFVAAIALVSITGLAKAASHGFVPASPRPHPAIEAAGVLLVLRAFASGATAMTGIEVISNAVPVFRPPEARHARQTLSVMLALLIAMFVAVVLVAHFDGATPGGQETVLSQIAHASLGSGAAYGYVQVATTLVLLIAANSAFNGFPRLLYFMARDGFVPRQYLRLGDRLAFSNGILLLAVPAAVIFVAFNGRTSPLIPLFAVGVFLAFTLAQSGMVAHWLAHREHGWRSGLATNLLGATLSGAVVLIAALTKFLEGAWVVVVLVPLIVLFCESVHAHYERARIALTPRPETDGRALPTTVAPPAMPAAPAPLPVEAQDSPAEVQSFAVVPVAVLDLAALHALAYAVSLARPVLAVHVSPTEEEAERFRRQWHAWGDHLPLELVVSPYRATVAPLANYIAALHEQRPELTLSLVVPEIVVARRWQRILHNRIASRLRVALTPYEGIVMTTVPFHLPP
jgi:amino acid transporter